MSADMVDQPCWHLCHASDRRRLCHVMGCWQPGIMVWSLMCPWCAKVVRKLIVFLSCRCCTANCICR